MKSLIWADIHNRIDELKKFLEMHYSQYDEFIFLGDFFDSFNDTLEETRATANFIKETIGDRKFYFLFGNHDIQYFICNPATICSGFSHEKYDGIKQILTEQEWVQFRWYYRCQRKWLISHAGFSAKLFSNSIRSAENDHELFDFALLDIKSNKPNKLIGNQGHFDQGILWCRWNDFVPINGVNQILGHTIISEPSIHYLRTKGNGKVEECKRDYSNYRKSPPKEDKLTSINWNIDCNNRYFAVIEDGNCSIHKTREHL